MHRWFPRVLSACLLAGGCASGPEGLRETPEGAGPKVLIDWDAKPFAEIPFPNDLSTRRDPTSPTGLRLNMPLETVTDHEREAREKLNGMTGFGLYSPIQVTFEGPLDLDDIVARHPDDFWRGDAAYADDAFLVVDVTQGSPTFGQAWPIDVGHGRYPVDTFGTNRYFPNDPHGGSISVLFEALSEDLDGDGVMDPGEDSDGDGIFDQPNVWPPGADPVDHLLSWYDLQTDTLILRPVIPFREKTTYAVVLTERLQARDGSGSVRSPWRWVHHTKQTDALEPLVDALPRYDLAIDDVAYAWTFTTGDVTGELRDLHAAIFDRTGPYGWIGEAVPAVISEAMQVYEADDITAFNLPTEKLLGPVLQLEAIPGVNVPLLTSIYEQFSERLVAGSFITPNLLVDVDDGGRWDADEHWRLDPYTGDAVVGTQRVPFTCVLPEPRDGVAAPFPVMLYGHGYGSNRLEVLYFGHAANMLGMAVCSMEFPGHGVELDPDQEALVTGLLENGGLGPALDSLLDGRHRDLDNDGRRNSGADQWIADPFHTRDMVRQGVLDWMQFVHAIQQCGQGTMQLSRYDESGVAVPTGETVASCDWNGDGTPDIGAGAPIRIAGGSLGGIDAGVAAAVLPEVEAFVPVVPGAGLVDIALRTSIGGAVEEIFGPLFGPLFLGYPDGAGGIRITQGVNSTTSFRETAVGTFSTVPVGGSVRLTNLRNGEVATAPVRDGGTFRVGVAADALHAGDKAELAGIPVTGVEEGQVYSVEGNLGLGDPLRLELLDASGRVVGTVEQFAADALFQGVTYRAGSPLVALAEGNGKLRGSRDARRLAFALALALEAGDPVAYAPHYLDPPLGEPFADLGGQAANVLVMPNVGDPWVSVNTGVALARAAGLVSYNTVDDRYGVTPDRFLIDRGVVRGIEERGPYLGADGLPALFDPDDLDDGADGYGAPSDTPLRLTVPGTRGTSGLRMPYPIQTGTHSIAETESESFDWIFYVMYAAVDYLAKGGTVIEDRPCYATVDCPDFPVIEVAP
jgi:hypothetical protein